MLDQSYSSYSGNVAAAASQSHKERNYWLEKLSGDIPNSSFPYDAKVITKARRKIEQAEGQISGELYAALLRTSNKSDARLLMLLMGGLKALLHKYTDGSDLIIGMPIYKQQVEGDFINTVLPLRSKLHDNMAFKDLLYQLKETIADAITHQNYPLRALMYDLNLAYSEENFSLFDVAVLLENIQEKKYIQHIHPNIIFRFLRREESLQITVEYNGLHYKHETILRIIDQYTRLMRQSLENVSKPLSQIDILSPEEKTAILKDFNATQVDDTAWRHKTLHRLFEDQVEKNPGEIALVCEEKIATYQEFNESANRLARVLREKGAKPEGIVAIMMESSIAMAEAVMAVLKSGAAYLPIDREIPEERKKYILKDSRVALVICDEHIETSLDDMNKRDGLQFIRVNDETVFDNNAEDPGLGDQAQPHNLAYIIYTSGSTGNPKGVMVEHRQVVNTLATRRQMYGMIPKHRALNLFSYAFDGFVTSFFTPIISGARIVLLSKKTIEDISKIIEVIHKQRITHFISVPVLYQVLITTMTEAQAASLQVITLAGDKLPANLLEATAAKNKNIEIVNEYGITEAAVMSTIYRHQEKDPQIKIGRPIPNNAIYITQPGSPHRLKPIGVDGEMCISGAGVTRGYMNTPTLTAERYMDNPFNPGQRLLKTGDVARWLPEGNLEFADRIDFQVKIRGFRVELGEIERYLLNHDEIKECVVLANTSSSGDKYLYAYIVTHRELGVTELREYLSKRLPDYMIPAYFVKLDHLPLSPNGKINRKALPAPEISTTTAEYVPPRNDIERKLVEIWAETLGVEKDTISIEANFFELGGHSLTATILSNQIHKVLNSKIPMLEIFKNPYIKHMAEFIHSTAQEVYTVINPVEEKEYHPLSSAQHRLFILQQLDLSATPYNVFQTVELIGEVNRQKLTEAFRAMIHRHESLRTSFTIIDGTAVQVIGNKEKIEFTVDYFDMTSTSGKESKPVREIIDRFVRPFDLTRAPLMRVGLIKLQETSVALMVDMHHIITDGVSNGILLENFLSFYSGKQLSPLKLQYKDYSRWQQSKRGKENLEKQKEYWLKEFKGEIPVLNLPYDNPRPAIKSFAGKITTFEISAEETKALNRVAQTQEATLFMALLGVYYTLLSKLSGQDDIVVGTPIAGRNHADLEPIIGIFINMLVLKNEIHPGQSFVQLLKHLKQRTLEAFENQDFQFDELVENLRLEKDTSRHPLFDVMIVLQNVYDVPGSRSEQKGTALGIRSFSHEHRTSQYDLTFTAVEQGNDKMYVEVEYCTALFNPETIDRFIQYFKTIISTVTMNPGLKIANIEIATEEDKKKILETFNDTTSEYPREKNLEQLFSQQIQTAPDQVAVVDIEHAAEGARGILPLKSPIQLTYNELNREAHLLAEVLVQKGIALGTIVGIMTERSRRLVLSMLAILKAGAVYLPIDPQSPYERILYMLKDSNAAILLSDLENLTPLPIPILYPVETLPQNTGIQKTASTQFDSERTRIPTGLNATSPAYVIYTSGSTGKPKGVIAQHRGIARLVKGTNYIEWKPGHKILPTGALAFDITTFEIWGPLLNGTPMVLTPQDIVLNGEKLTGIISKHHISILHLIPQLLNQLTEANPEIFAKLHYFLVGGDLVRPHYVNKIKKINENLNIIHMYGPTENTTFSTFFPVEREFEHNLPIGKPISNSTVYIMDHCHQLLPIGVPGELIVGGDGVALGYLNKPEMTSEKFLTISPVPSLHARYEKIYKTGDLARWLPEGNIQFLGRQDHQVKIRGIRIELEEIENRLLKHEDIKEAIILAYMDSNQQQPYLCAYIVPSKELSIIRLRDYLAAFLPETMIPAYFVQLEAMPLNPNGKVNRKALPLPEENQLKENTPYEAPGNEVEAQLVKTWEMVLGKENIGINDNFFMIGGDSIKAIQIIARMKKAGYKMEMKDLYQNRRISGLAPLVKKIGRQSDQSTITGIIPLTPIQADFFATTQIHPHHFNQSLMLIAKQKLSADIIKKVFTKIQEHHDVLRMSYTREGNRVIQTNHGLEYPLEIQEIDLRHNENPAAAIESACNRIQSGIALEKGPLMKLGLFRLEEEDRLLITIHHLVMDGVSWRILLEDIVALYQHYQNPHLHQPPTLPLKSDSFKYWSHKLQEYANGKEILKEIPFWQNIETQSAAVPRKTNTLEREQLKKANHDIVDITLDKESTVKLLNEVHQAYNTEINDILLAALALALYEWTGSEYIPVNLEGHGREEFIEDIDISRTIGWYTARYPVILQISANLEIPRDQFLSRIIKTNKEGLREIPNKGTGYGILQYLVPAEARGNLTFAHQPEISFNYLGEVGQVGQAEGLETAAPGLFTLSMQGIGTPFSPEQISLHTLEINGMASNNQLRFSFSYNRHCYDKSDIETLTRRYRENLMEIIAHCLSKEETEKTLSDYTVSGMDQKELDNVYNALGDLFNT